MSHDTSTQPEYSQSHPTLIIAHIYIYMYIYMHIYMYIYVYIASLHLTSISVKHLAKHKHNE